MSACHHGSINISLKSIGGRGGVRLARMTHMNRITDEEDGSIVAHQIPVALLRVELDGEAAWIARSVRRAALAACINQAIIAALRTVDG